MDKKEIRSIVRSRKKAMTENQINAASEKLGQLFRSCDLYRQAKSIYFYLPYNQEVRTVPMIEAAFADGKAVAVPKCYGDEMRFITLESLEGIAPGYCNIPEPVFDEPVACDTTALVLMPGLAFDPQGHRIGYGGGFYDKFLEAEPNHPTVALCYDFQMFPHLEVDSHDIPVDLVLSAGFEGVE